MPVVAIIGTRQPDPVQRTWARSLAQVLSHSHNCEITTGGAYGVDQASMEGAAIGRLHVFLPWASYNQDIIPKHARRTVASFVKNPTWYESVKKFHPNPSALSSGMYSLHARNYGIIEPAHVVIAFPKEKSAGGTGQGIRITESLGKPVLQYNRNMPTVYTFEQILDRVCQLLSPLPSVGSAA